MWWLVSIANLMGVRNTWEISSTYLDVSTLVFPGWLDHEGSDLRNGFHQQTQDLNGLLGGGGNSCLVGEDRSLAARPWGATFCPGPFLWLLFPVFYEVECYAPLTPWCSAQVHGANKPWTEPSETVSHNKSFLLLFMSGILSQWWESNWYMLYDPHKLICLLPTFSGNKHYAFMCFYVHMCVWICVYLCMHLKAKSKLWSTYVNNHCASKYSCL
jgi:hypothetical protein